MSDKGPGLAPNEVAKAQELLYELKIGEISYRKGTQWFYLAVAWGFVEVLPNQVRVLAETAERANEIDLDRAQRAKEVALLRQDPRGIQDAVRVERGFEPAHEIELRRIARVVQVLPAQRAHAVLRADRAAVSADCRIHCVAQPLETVGAMGRHREVQIAVADVTEHEVRHWLRPARKFRVEAREKSRHRVDR